MPRYSYMCGQCSAISERIVPVAECDAQTCDCGAVLARVFEPCRIQIPQRHRAINDTGSYDLAAEREANIRALEETQRTGTSHYGFPVVEKPKCDIANIRGLS